MRINENVKLEAQVVTSEQFIAPICARELNPRNFPNCFAILRAAVARESEAPLGFTQLAMAYGRKGDYAEADLASAQAAFLRGDNKTARELASRAKTRFAIGTPGWVKADDIVSAKPLPGSNN